MADDAKDPAGLAAKCPGHSFPTGGWAMAANPADCQCCLAEALGRVMAERDRLTARVAELAAALRPFAAMAEVVCKEDMPLFATDMMDGESGEKVAWTRHVHRAADLLAPGPEGSR
jgi:hypothetical protein